MKKYTPDRFTKILVIIAVASVLTLFSRHTSFSYIENRTMDTAFKFFCALAESSCIFLLGPHIEKRRNKDGENTFVQHLAFAADFGAVLAFGGVTAGAYIPHWAHSSFSQAVPPLYMQMGRTFILTLLIGVALSIISDLIVKKKANKK